MNNMNNIVIDYKSLPIIIDINSIHKNNILIFIKSILFYIIYLLIFDKWILY